MATLPQTKAKPAPFTPPPPGNLLNSIDIKYGPEDVLGRLFLKADDAARRRGVSISIATFPELVAATEANASTWRRVNSMYDPAFSAKSLTPDRAFVLLGRNVDGEVVAAQCVKRLDIPHSSLHDELESGRVFFDDPARDRLPGEVCDITAPTARLLKGKVAIGGGAWYRPDYRGRQLAAIVPRIARGLAIANWNIDSYCVLFIEGPVKGGVPETTGYNRGEWHVWLKNARDGSPRTCLHWMYQDELIADMSGFLATFDAEPAAQVDGGVLQRRA